MSTKNSLPIIIAILCLAVIAVGAVSQFAFNNTGTVATINVAGFLEAACTTPLTELTWPPITAGETDWRLIYVNSTGTIATVLNLTTTTWLPTEAEALVTATWDIEGVTILPNHILQANLTLTLAEDMGTVTTFTFTTIINAEEEP